MEKLDLKKKYKALYTASAKEASLITVPKLNYIRVDGAGDPNTSPQFQEATQALYAVSYTLKFMVKRSQEGPDYGVMHLEGLWWADDMEKFSIERKGDWKWTLMILQPDFITESMFRQAVDEVVRKKGLVMAGKLRFESVEEGLCAQILHIGPYAEEPPTVRKLHDFIEEKGYAFSGLHHEIYLSDPRKAAPEKMKTILRQPVKGE